LICAKREFTYSRHPSPPLGDAGGDHDPCFSCVDDPVSAVDPEGTFAFLLPLGLFAAGQALATGLGWGGVKLAQKGAEMAAKGLGDQDVQERLPQAAKDMGEATTDAMAKATAVNAGVTAAAATGAAAAEAAPAVARGAAQAASAVKDAATTAGQVAATTALDPKNIERAQDFVSGALPTPPTPSWAGLAGFATGQVNDALDFTGALGGLVEGYHPPISIEE
jgi:hypothetical protein